MNRTSEGALISVIVPAFNVEPYIGRCIESIREQTHQDLEIIVVNDCSTDRTGALLDDISRHDGRIKVLHHEKNSGVHATRAAGIEAARGAYIGFVDGDDWIAPHMYENLLRAARLENADIVVGGARCASNEGVLGQPKVRFRSRRVYTDKLLAHFCRLQFGTGVLWNKLYEAGLIKTWASVRLERAVDAAEDYIVNVGAFAAASRVVTLPGCHYYYLDRAESASRLHARARNFSRTVRAYVACLETYAASLPETRPEIDRLYARQLRMPPYRVETLAEFADVQGDIAESLRRLAAVHPAGVHALIHAFDPNAPGEVVRLRPAVRRLFGAAKAVGVAAVSTFTARSANSGPL